MMTWQSLCDWFGVDSTKSRHLVSCPAHDDAAPSLSIRQTQDGKVLMHCFAGCSFDAVLAALRNSSSKPEPPTRVAESSRTSRDWPSLLLRLDPKKDRAIARHLCRRIGTGTVDGYLRLFPKLRLIPTALGIPAIAVYDDTLGGQAMPLFADAFYSAKTGKTYKKYTLPGTNCKIPLFFNTVTCQDVYITEGISDWLALASQLDNNMHAYLPMLGAAHNIDATVAQALQSLRTYCLYDADKAGEAGAKKLQMLTGCIRLAPPDDYKDWRSYLIAHHPSDI